MNGYLSGSFVFDQSIHVGRRGHVAVTYTDDLISNVEYIIKKRLLFLPPSGNPRKRKIQFDKFPNIRKTNQEQKMAVSVYQTVPRASIKAIVLRQSLFLRIMRTPAGCCISMRRRAT